ncbi:O-antigen ligase family protein [Stutzerimonas stutzeri]|uniref:O-antigen ligase-related domain-containing protein n=1 Tax=Stutzerimonas stutzeri TaxID=316 RepID=A0A172WT83_STUST|nr:O-antigen ligase family protein [Stutzerimonas stutzeri]ANF26721.1 hypothetical protein PS273GM_17015 [Stutzerimonas stutzeri]
MTKASLAADQNESFLDRLFLLFLVLLAYAFVVVGGLFSAQTIKLQGIPLNPLFYSVPLVFLAALFRGFRRTFLLCCALYAPLFLFLFFGYINGGQNDYGFEKLDNVVFVSIAASSCLGFAALRYGILAMLRTLILSMIIVLTLTLMYKMHFGFMDRSVRFFLNGPIVFGWMMGFSSIISVYLYKEVHNRKYMLVALIFLMACLWSASKGPLVALILSLGVFFIASKDWNFFIGYLTIVAVLVFGAEFLANIPGLERLSAISRMINKETGESDYGSVGIRLESFGDSIGMITANPYGGVGLGLWGEHSNTGLEYPHNVLLELMSELGVFAGCGFFLVILLLTVRSGFLGVVVFTYFALCLSFSGDSTYLRYLLFFLVPCFLHKNVSKFYG